MATLSDSPISTGVYTASTSITTTGTVVVATGADVTFKAGVSIKLNPGFLADASSGGSFLAKIEDCSIPVVPLREQPEVIEDQLLEYPVFNPVAEIKDFVVAPNPFTEQTNIYFYLPVKRRISIILFD